MGPTAPHILCTHADIETLSIPSLNMNISITLSNDVVQEVVKLNLASLSDTTDMWLKELKVNSAGLESCFNAIAHEALICTDMGKDVANIIRDNCNRCLPYVIAYNESGLTGYFL